MTDLRDVVIGLPTALWGGTQMQTRAQAAALVAAGFRVTVCCYYATRADVLATFEQAGAAVRTLGLALRRGGRYLLAAPAFVRAFGGLLREIRPHFVHVQYQETGYLPIRTARRHAPRVLATVHATADRFGRNVRRVRQAAALCDAMLCVSAATERSLFGDAAAFDEALLRGGRRHFTLPNVVDLAEADAIAAETDAAVLRRQLNLAAGPVVVALGRLKRVKGQDVLLEALPAIRAAAPGAQLLLVGAGRADEALRRRARQLGVDRAVVFAGEMPRREALRALMVADVVAMPSRSESFGLAAAEAMAFARPVVASDVGGLGEVVADGQTGTLVPPGDPPALAAAVAALLNDAQRRRTFGAAGRRRAEREFAADVFARRLLTLYRALA